MVVMSRGRRGVQEPGEVLLEWSSSLAVEGESVRRGEVRAAAAELVEASAAQARAEGAQVRAIHRLWVAAAQSRAAARREAMAAAQAEFAAQGRVREDPLGPLAEAEHQLVVDVAAEVGAALCLPAGTACRRVEDAVVLVQDLPQVLVALEAGRIGWAQASVLVEQWRELVVEGVGQVPGHTSPAPPVEAVTRLVGELLERAGGCTAAQLRAVARHRRKALIGGAQERARRAARKRRGVWVEAAEEGLAYLHALLDAPVAVAAAGRMEALAQALGEDVPGPEGLGVAPQLGVGEAAEARSVGELRADVLADLLLDGELPAVAGFPRGVRATVSVMVPVGVLTAGELDATAPTAGPAAGGAVADGCAAAVLSGYGPISAVVARQLAAGAGAWHRVLTHPVSGVVLDHDRRVYAVPADLRRLVVLRDGTCRFPGCRRRAEDCEIDHTIAWAQGGSTAETNLAALCRVHHRIKHRHGHLGRWTARRVAEDPGDGAPAGAVLEWTSPGGLVHRTLPEHQPPPPAPPAQEPPPYADEDWPPPEPDTRPGNRPTAEQPPPCADEGRPRAGDPPEDPAPF